MPRVMHLFFTVSDHLRFYGLPIICGGSIHNDRTVPRRFQVLGDNPYIVGDIDWGLFHGCDPQRTYARSAFEANVVCAFDTQARRPPPPTSHDVYPCPPLSPPPHLAPPRLPPHNASQ